MCPLHFCPEWECWKSSNCPQRRTPVWKVLSKPCLTWKTWYVNTGVIHYAQVLLLWEASTWLLGYLKELYGLLPLWPLHIFATFQHFLFAGPARVLLHIWDSTFLFAPYFTLLCEVRAREFSCPMHFRLVLNVWFLVGNGQVAFCGGILFLIFGVHSLLSGAE